MKKVIKISIFLIMSFFIGVSHSGDKKDALSKSEVETLLVGNTMKGKHLKKGFEFIMYINNDGSLKQDKDGDIYTGKWHVDGKSRFCWNYNHKNKEWCRLIKKNKDGTYTKFKDSGKEVRKFKVLSGNAENL